MAQSNSNTPHQTLLVGLSGPSSSGKTTLARLLRQIFNSNHNNNKSNNTTSSSASLSPETERSLRLFILHEDDFYKTDTLIPVKTITSAEHGTRDLQDWDCAESLDLPLLKSTLEHIKRHSALPEDMFSKEDQNTVGESGVSDEVVTEYSRQIGLWMSQLQLRQGEKGKLEGKTGSVVICLFDGFLVYPDPKSESGSLEHELHEALQGLLDVKLFVSGTRELTIERRSKRSGYVTLEGFWADPPGYVEDVVWPNYRWDHAWLFRREGKGEDDGRTTMQAVDAGRVNRLTAEEAGILVGPGNGDAHLREIVPWAIDRLKEAVSGIGR